MDKYEYKLRSEEIKSLIKEREFVKAVEIADTIDWTRVRSVSMLCTISDLYKINRRYKEAKELLLQAYEKHPGGRTILYSLCELCIKTDDVIGAIEYYKEFVQLAPTDNGKFILQYKIYEAQDVSLEERIAVLEELKKREYLEKWGYELAYLYHRIGLGTKCVEECDELILWFREGRYIKKAMELKMLHQPLSEDQESLYKRMIPSKEQEQYDQQTKVYEGAEDIQVKTVDVSQYNTINLQKELAESMKEVLVADNAFSPLYSEETEEVATEVTETEEPVESARPLPSQMPTAVINDIFDKLLENSPEEVEAEFPQLVPGEGEDISPEEEVGMVELSAPAPVEEEVQEEPEVALIEEVPAENVEEFFGETEEIPEILGIPEDYLEEDPVEEPVAYVEATDTGEAIGEPITETESEEKKTVWSAHDHAVDYVPGSITEAIMAPLMTNTDRLREVIIEEPEAVGNDESVSQTVTLQEAENVEAVVKEERPSIRELMKGKPGQDLTLVNPPEEMGHLLSQESDGQISLVVPESEAIEKQITGQLNLEDILAEWEKTKKENEEKRKRETQQRVLEQTGTMFTEFEEKIRDGILEKLEKNIEIPELNLHIEDEISDVVLEKTVAEAVAETVEEMQEGPEINIGEMKLFEAETSMEEDSFEELEEIVEEDSLTEEGIPEEAFTFVENTALPKEETSVQTEVPQQQKELIQTTSPVQEEKVSEADVNRNYEEPVRSMTEEEMSLFAPFVQTKGARVRLMQALDKISLAAYTGNVFVTGETQEEAVELAKSVVRDVQMTDRNFSGKVAKVTGQSLNNRDVEPMVERLANGALIIEKAAGMDAQTMKDLLKALNQEKTGIVVVLQDTKKAMHKMMEYFAGMKELFNVHIEVEELGDEALVAYGKKYARHLEYAIDEMGVLALHTRIAEMQTSDHIVTVADVREIVDEAIENANRKNLRHFTDVLFAKRYDDDDMIILRERDFLD